MSKMTYEEVSQKISEIRRNRVYANSSIQVDRDGNFIRPLPVPNHPNSSCGTILNWHGAEYRFATTPPSVYISSESNKKLSGDKPKYILFKPLGVNSEVIYIPEGENTSEPLMSSFNPDEYECIFGNEYKDYMVEVHRSHPEDLFTVTENDAPFNSATFIWQVDDTVRDYFGREIPHLKSARKIGILCKY